MLTNLCVDKILGMQNFSKDTKREYEILYYTLSNSFKHKPLNSINFLPKLTREIRMRNIKDEALIIKLAAVYSFRMLRTWMQDVEK